MVGALRNQIQEAKTILLALNYEKSIGRIHGCEFVMANFEERLNLISFFNLFFVFKLGFLTLFNNFTASHPITG